MDLSATEIRVAGCLVEKQRTTPDAYPLSLNALRLACNQATNREPVMDLDEPTIRQALERLHRRGWTRLASSSGSRTMKYRHLMDRELSVDGAELSLLAVLMLRGPQTSSELHARVERLHRFESAAGVDEALDSLAGRGLAAVMERQAGRRGQRWRQLLEGSDSPSATASPSAPRGPTPSTEASLEEPSLERRVADLEREVAELRRLEEERHR